MNELKVFENQEFGKIRTVTIGGEPWLVGKDVAVALGYKDTKNALKDHVDSEDKRGWQITTPGGEQTMTIINESGLYALIFGSKLPSAKRFKHWVTSEVLPSIRKTGGYGSQEKMLLKVMEMLSNVADSLVKTADSIAKTADSLERTAIHIENSEGKCSQELEASQSLMAHPEPILTGYSYGQCKMETFPADLRQQVDQMFDQMLEQQALNFSMIARYCTMNGFPISSPSVKTYYQRHFASM